jgi:hypothetical protein
MAFSSMSSGQGIGFISVIGALKADSVIPSYRVTMRAVVCPGTEFVVIRIPQEFSLVEVKGSYEHEQWKWHTCLTRY